MIEVHLGKISPKLLVYLFQKLLISSLQDFEPSRVSQFRKPTEMMKVLSMQFARRRES
jgi:hypothetical protein